ncbi:MAG: phosphatase [Micavibrio aeruginosavorus]|uniref:phosphoglycolate phosphatase n=1 Tax=Micavibrio aeruginosavorus TaxID=349221 RepID=A0A2W4ZU58_9BACT|nr:MAG: phosphatase [Micavibrio aeruginosavorus]
MTHLAVFDWNGTLFDDTAATLKATNSCLRSFGRPEIDLHTMQETFSFPLIHFYEKMGVPVDEYLARADEEGSVFLKTYEEAATECAVMDGAFELLEWLNANNVHCMVLSNHLQHCLDLDVVNLGIAPYMKDISGNETKATITQGLSKQIRLEAYMKEKGFKAEKTFIIGDSHEEPELAKRLGILGISIAGGLLSAARLEKYKADYIIRKLHELRPILQKHWNLA